MLSLGLALICAGCKKTSPEAAAREIQSTPAEAISSPESEEPQKTASFEGYAVWYDVPVNSLPERRAGKDELTAAHNRLPFGTMVRVTRLENGKSVIVRITDRGVRSRVGIIDLCKEAAEKLEMISDGRARVRLDILPDDKGANATPDSNSRARTRN
ncbi:MAG TPA: septal ring lytic transglycosylase RlpA family protein [Chthoniobacterales bacterium]|nr:septal ring lytic transglycosylase RlpA family protein [Chthoniobacterales bacterium]